MAGLGELLAGFSLLAQGISLAGDPGSCLLLPNPGDHWSVMPSMTASLWLVSLQSVSFSLHISRPPPFFVPQWVDWWVSRIPEKGASHHLFNCFSTREDEKLA